MNVIKLSTLLLCTFMPSPIRLAIWRLLGFKVGRGCHVAMFSIVVADTIELGHGSVIETLTLVYRPSLFCMGERSRIAGFVRIIGYGGRVELRQQSFIALGCLLDISAHIELGDRSQIGPRCILYSHGGTGLIYNMRYPHRIGKITIGSDCWLGMNCVVHPGIVIGNRVITLPGMVVRCNVPDDTAMIAPVAEHRLIPTSRLLIGVTDEVRRSKIESIFFHLAGVSRGVVSDQIDPHIWRLYFPGGKTLYLPRTDAARLDASKLSSMDDAVWTLFESGVIKGVTTFCFEKLTVYGPWTPFAERLASFLLREGGAHFVFQSTPSRHTPASKDSHETC
ncbi:MAG: hypothetical protein FJ119_08110 [Deltaproteobacteria bacterium]|nr:hypothetical protein [Deltaproteobacteria bacterium]